jgi:hypothetical protein
MSGVQGMGIRGGKGENLQERERSKKTKEKSKAPGATPAPGVF